MKKIVLFLMICCLTGAIGSTNIFFEQRPAVDSVGTASSENCLLCGKNSLWGYYQDIDSIGIINLATGTITDIKILKYEEDSIWDETFGTGTRFCGDGHGRYCYLSTMESRGICNINLSWENNAYLKYDEIASLYCETCMRKLNELDLEWTEGFDEKRCPFAIVDFTTGELYSLNGWVTACFVRDYYMHFDFGEEKIDGFIVYTPKRF